MLQQADIALNFLQEVQKDQLDHKPPSPLGGMLPTSYNLKTNSHDGTFPCAWQCRCGLHSPTLDYISVGSLADSAYEYFLKGYLMTSRIEKRLLDMCMSSQTFKSRRCPVT